MSNPRQFTGGIRRGLNYYVAYNASWPLVRLTVEPERLIIRDLFFLGSLSLDKNQITRLSKYRGFFSTGVRIEHSAVDFSQFLVFWTFEVEAVTASLIESGYAFN